MSGLSYAEIQSIIESEDPVALVTIVRGEPLGRKIAIFEDGRVLGSLGIAELDQAATKLGHEHLADDRSGLIHLREDVQAFIEVYARPPHLVLIGAVHTAIALGHIGKLLGFRVTVVDARERFATRERFPHVDELVIAWPDEALDRMRIDSRTYIAILTHDPKFDEPALKSALARPARYIGAIGSRKTSADRIGRLKRQGLTDEQLAKIHAPIGLNLGARTPEEIALSIAAEIVAVRRGQIGHLPRQFVSHAIRPDAIDAALS
ncbi:MAG TPA: XdhC/CoxI family protein [Chloroflexota bacterium]|nr:XdhC/CoxI family protein [Chloroflexota bacterium]